MTLVFDKLLRLIKSKTINEPEKWLVNLAIDSVYIKEGNTFAK